MSDAEIDAISFIVRDVDLNGTSLEIFVNGIYTAILAVTFYIVLVKRERAMGRVLMGTMLLLYISSTLHMVQRWFLMRYAFITNGDTSTTIFLGIANAPIWLIMLGAVTLGASMLLADCVMIWRCWAVWGKSWKAALLPVLTTVVGTAFCIIALIIQANPADGLDGNRMAFVNSSVIYFSFSLGTTAICTILIVYRIMSFNKTVAGFKLSNYHAVIEIIVESALLYSITLILVLPLLVRGNFVESYPHALLAQITGIAPTLIIARVSLGHSRAQETWSKPGTALQFGGQSTEASIGTNTTGTKRRTSVNTGSEKNIVFSANPSIEVV